MRPSTASVQLTPPQGPLGHPSPIWKCPSKPLLAPVCCSLGALGSSRTR